MSEILSIIILIVIILFVFGLLTFVRDVLLSDSSKVFNYKGDHDKATEETPICKAPKRKHNKDYTFLGIGTNRKDVLMPNDAKHVFVCGTTGSGKTILLSNFIKSGADYDYPMLIVDGKGDTDVGSLLELTKELCFAKGRKIYVINLNNPYSSDKYNPFKNTDTDIIKDMLINMTNWSEEHYKYNTERYLGRLCKLLELKGIAISLDTITEYLPVEKFKMLSMELVKDGAITKAENLADIDLAKTSGSIAEAAVARFAVIKESKLGKIFDSSGIDIYTALKENAIILFILNPLLYPEMSPLIGNLIIIDSKKAVSNFYSDKKKRIFYIFDEINVYASPALLDLVNKSRSANITCVLATQSLSDLELVSPQFKEQIIENCNNYVVLRQNSGANAEGWSNVIGTKVTMQATYQIKEDESTGLGSLRKTREYIYHPDDIKLLATGNAIFVSRDEMCHTKLKVNKPF